MKELDCIELPVLLGSRLIYNSNYPNDSLLYFHDVENRDNVVVCKLAKDGVVLLDTVKKPAAVEFFEMFMLAYDSIACFEHVPNRMMILLRNDGSVIDTLNLYNGWPYVNPISQHPRLGNSVCFANTDDTLALKGIMRSEYYGTVRPVYQYDFASGEGKTWGGFPESFATALGFEETPKICAVDDSTVVLSFMCVDSLYLYVNGVLKSRHHCKSRYIDRFPEYDTTKVFDLGYYRQFIHARPEYLDLLYDPSSQRFFRTALHEQPHEEQGKQITKTNRTWSLMVINKELEVENEYLFRCTEHQPFYVIPDRRGVFVSKTPVDENDLQLKLSLFKP